MSQPRLYSRPCPRHAPSGYSSNVPSRFPASTETGHLWAVMDEPERLIEFTDEGQLVPQSQCVLPMHDLGIALGAAVTDLLRRLSWFSGFVEVLHFAITQCHAKENEFVDSAIEVANLLGAVCRGCSPITNLGISECEGDVRRLYRQP